MAGREYPEHPLVGVGGVVIDDQHVLLVRRARPPLQGEWSLPGGLVETGERLRDAVVREIWEETGIAVHPERIITVLDRITRDEEHRVKYHYVLVDFLCRVEREAGDNTKLPPPHPSDDVSEARWVPRAEIAPYNLRPATLRVIQKAFQIA